MYARFYKLPSIYTNLVASYGDSITIYRSSGNFSTHGQWVAGRTEIAPEEVNYVRFMMFGADSGVVRGDYIKDESTNEEYFIMAAKLDTAITNPFSLYTELYLINYPETAVQRETTSYDQYGNPTGTTWNTVVTVPMNIQHVNGSIPYKDGLLLEDTVFKCVTQVDTGIQLLDRVVINGKPYEVSDINLTESPGLAVVQVKTDVRS